jgi:hypothetical protein
MRLKIDVMERERKNLKFGREVNKSQMSKQLQFVWDRIVFSFRNISA